MREGYNNIGGADFEEEDNYFISLTDLMTGVIFVFVILLVVYAMTSRSAKHELAEERMKVEQLAKAEGQAREFQEKVDALDRELKEKQSEAEQLANRAREFQEKVDALDRELKEKQSEAEQLANRAREFQKRMDYLDREVRDKQLKVQEIDSLAMMLKQREQQRAAILKNLISHLETRGVRLSLDRDNGIVRLPEELLFDSGQAVLRPEGARALQILAAELRGVLEGWCSSDQEFRLEALFIEGHTDNVRIKNARFADNWELSTSRAVNVARAFKQSQPQLAQFENPRGLPVLGVSGYGENRPVAENTTEEGRRRNRRIDLRFLVAYPTDEQISKVTHGLISPDAARPSSQRDTNTNH